MLTVIGLCGHSRAGKDTVAGVLCSVGGFLRVGLADGVREALGALDGPTWELAKGRDASGQTNRLAMQLCGAECREDVGNDLHWVDHALIKIRFASTYADPPRSLFVVPDVRYPHEPARLRDVVASWGGTYETWRVVRPGVGREGGHSSETQVDAIPCGRTVDNGGTRRELVRGVIAIVEALSAPTNSNVVS